MQRSQERLAEKEAQMEMLRREKAQSEEQRAMALVELDKAADILTVLERQVHDRDTEIEVLRTELNKQAKTLEALRAEVAVVKQRAPETQPQELKQLADELERENLALKSELQNRGSSGGTTEALLNETTSALNEWIEECQKLQAIVSERDREIKATTERSRMAVQELEEAITAEREEIQLLKSSLTSNQQVQFEQSSQEKAQIVLEKEKLMQRVRQVEGELEASLRTEQSLLNDLNTLLQDNELSVQETKRLEDKALSLEKEVNLQKGELRVAAEIKEQNNTLLQKAQQLNDEVNMLKLRVREGVAELEVRNAVEATLRESYSKAQAKIGDLENELHQRDKEESALADWSRSLMRTLSKI